MLASILPTDGKSYSSNNDYKNAPGLGSNRIVYNGSGNSFTMTGLNLNRPYTIGIVEYNGAGTGTNYRSDVTGSTVRTPGAVEQPTIPPSAVTVEVVSVPEYAVKISWNNGDGEGRVVLVREGQGYVSPPIVDGFTYSANNDFQLAPADGPNRVVYNGSGNSLILKGISPTQMYGIAIFEYNGSGLPVNYLETRASGTVPKYARQQTIDNLAFQYRYDARQRLVAKKVPGADWVYMVYDDRDRLVMTQDGVQRKNKQWVFTKYDAFNRPVLTGIYTSPTVLSQEEMAQQISFQALNEAYIGSHVNHGYSNLVFPTNNISYLTVTYYDNYDFKDKWHPGFHYTANDVQDQSVNGVAYVQSSLPSSNVIGQVTGTKVRLLDGTVTNGNHWLATVNYYDSKYRLIQTVSDNYLGGVDRITNLYDFVGKILASKTTHYKLGFKDFVNTTYKNGTISKTVASTSWNSGAAASIEVLPANEDGWVEFTAASTGKEMMVGLTHTNDDAHWNKIDHVIYLTDLGNVEVREKGSTNLLTTSPSYSVGDVFRIERRQGRIYHYQNGNLLLDRPATSNSLMVDLSIRGSQGKIYGLRSSFGAGESQVVNRRFEYDHAGRLVNLSHRYNDHQEALVAQNSYNELGQLVEKRLHSTSEASSDAQQSVDYRYNIRGWLTSMNNASLSNDGDLNDDTNDLFGFELGYASNIGIGSTSLYNGNISGMKWSKYGEPENESGYAYTYDPMNRIKSATFKQKKNSWTSPLNLPFAETDFDYDLNGNIRSLTRYDEKGSDDPMDILVYDYGTTPSNTLFKVTDMGDDTRGFKELNTSVNDFVYDNNGNMIADNNKGQAVIRNGDFNEGSAHWVVTGGGFEFVDESVKKTDAGVSNRIEQLNIIKPSGRYVVTVDMEKTSSTGTVAILIGEKSTTLTNGLNSFVVTAGAGKDVRITFSAGTLATIHKIEVMSATLISYNHLNLPQLVHQGKATLQYIYDANGRKLAEELSEGTAVVKSSVYAGEFYYENDTLKFINHEEGRIIPEDTAAVYQYHLTDHLGNVRLTFTTKEVVESATATIEPGNAENEAGEFLYYDEAVRVHSDLFDHTNDDASGDPDHSAVSVRLTGRPDEQYGLAKSLSVMPGDIVRIEVFAKYIDPNETNWQSPLIDLLTMMGNPTSGIVVDGGAPGSIGAETFPLGMVLSKAGGASAPKAYLNYISFDSKNQPILTDPTLTNYIQISDVGKENGSNVPHERIYAEIHVKQAGLMYIYLSNDNVALGGNPVDVFFDDFRVEHVHSKVVQNDDYYPFGLTFNSYKRENSVPNKTKLFQGQEHIDDLGLNWDSYRYRNHDPAIGRFFNIDPMASAFYYNSPYAFSENKVTTHREMEGLEAFFIHGTMADNSMWKKDVAAFIMRELKPYFSTDQTLDVGFKWNDYKGGGMTRNWLNNNENDRAVAARMLVAYILKNRKQGQGITLVGHSHGGNVAIQAARILFEKHNISVNIVNFNTPAFNGSNDPENPWDNFGIDEMLHFFTDGDWVAGPLSGSSTYKNVPNNIKQIELTQPLKRGLLGWQEHYFDNVNWQEVLNRFQSMMGFYNDLGGSGEKKKKKQPDADKKRCKETGGC